MIVKFNHCLIAFLATFAARAEMIHSDAIGNDPAKERVCREQTQANGDSKGAKLVPFEIDKDYVEKVRNPRFGGHPGVTFIAIEEASGLHFLIQCDVLASGKYGPVWVRNEDSTPALWRLPNKPRQFSPGIHTLAGRAIAMMRCIDAAVAKINHPNYDHISDGAVEEVGTATGSMVAGVKAERYDVIVSGTAMYKSAGPDMDAFPVVCLFSPMLEVKAIQIK